MNNIFVIDLGEELKMENYNQILITVDELCESLMIGKNAAYKLLKTGTIKSFRIGRAWKIPRESLDDFIKQQTNQQKWI